LVQLSCADAGTGNIPTANDGLAIGGIQLEGLTGNVAGSRATDVGLSVPAGDTLYFFKAPVWLKAGASATIELPTEARGYLAWVPARVWTGRGAGDVDLAPWMASKLVLAGCPDRDVTYFGGVLSTDPHICLELHVADETGKSRQIPVGTAMNC
jgi:hypothetical protein